MAHGVDRSAQTLEFLKAPFGNCLEALNGDRKGQLGVPATRIHEIVKERRAVMVDTAARRARHFGSDAASWLVMQANDDLKTLATMGDIQRQVPAPEQLAA